MDRRVFKYEISDVTVINLPKGAKPLYFGMQNSKPHVWIEVPQPRHEHHPEGRRIFRVFGTGHPISEGATYIGTCFDGPFVWHLYEVVS